MDLQTQRLIMAAGGASAEPTYLDDVFKNYLYHGTGSNQTFNNGIDLTKGGLVWLKCYDQGKDHSLTDTERGVNKQLATQNTGAETTTAGQVTAFNNNGFTIGTNGEINQNTREMASWTFRKQKGFFDVVTWTGNGTAGREIAHDLGADVGFLMVKRLDSDDEWRCWHRKLNGGTNVGQYSIVLNSTDGNGTGVGIWNNTAPTSSVFTVGDDNKVNADGGSYVAYLFAHESASFGTDSDQKIISCGSYAGTDSEHKITLPFEPQWLLLKVYTRTEGWVMFDVMRGISNNNDAWYLEANANSAQNMFDNYIAVNPDGFTVKGSHNSINANGENYIYIAIAAENGNTMNPEKITAGTDVFTMAPGNGSSTIPNFTSNFPVDFVFYRRPATTQSYETCARLLTERYCNANTADDWGDWTEGTFDSNIGFQKHASHGSDYQAWMWRRHAGFDVMTYDGTGSSGATFKHNLGVVPEMIWIKHRSGGGSDWNWAVGHKGLNAGTNPWNYYLTLNNDDTETDNANRWNDTAPTSTVFTLGNAGNVNSSGYKYIAMLFASVTGISKVGYFTGDGSDTMTITTGFQPRFLLIKDTDSSNGWFLLDTTRGWVVGNDWYLKLNDNAAQISYDLGAPTSTGFTSTGGNTVNGNTYIYYAHS